MEDIFFSNIKIDQMENLVKKTVKVGDKDREAIIFAFGDHLMKAIFTPASIRVEIAISELTKMDEKVGLRHVWNSVGNLTYPYARKKARDVNTLAILFADAACIAFGEEEAQKIADGEMLCRLISLRVGAGYCKIVKYRVNSPLIYLGHYESDATKKGGFFPVGNFPSPLKHSERARLLGYDGKIKTCPNFEEFTKKEDYSQHDIMLMVDTLSKNMKFDGKLLVERIDNLKGAYEKHLTQEDKFPLDVPF